MPRIRFTWGMALAVPAIIFVAAVLQATAANHDLDPPAPLAYVLVFTGLYLVVGLVHELGHVVAGWALGLRWKELRVGLGLGVMLTDRSNGEQIVISLAGPAVHLLGSTALIMASGMGPDLADPVSMVGWLTLIEAVVNVVIPHPRLDGGRALLATWRCLRGRSAESFVSPRVEDEPTDTHEPKEALPWQR